MLFAGVAGLGRSLRRSAALRLALGRLLILRAPRLPRRSAPVAATPVAPAAIATVPATIATATAAVLERLAESRRPHGQAAHRNGALLDCAGARHEHGLL